jgi:hypothetical protein
MYQIIDDMGMLTASAQLRSRGREGSAIADELIGFANTSGWQQKILAYATTYALQVKNYYAQFLNDYERHAFTAHRNTDADGKKIA